MRITRDIPLLALRPLALTIGNFDGVHIGHRAMLAELSNASRRLGVPSCVMLFEPQPREFFAPDKAPARLTPLRDKLELLADCGVDQVQICRFDYHFAQMAPTEFIERILVSGLGVRWLQVGDDFRFGARRAGDFAMLQKSSVSMGFEVHSLPSVRVDGVRVSSTAVREALASGQLWKTETAYIQIVDLGKRLIDYRMMRELGQARRTQTSSIETMEKYLKTNEGRLVKGNSRN